MYDIKDFSHNQLCDIIDEYKNVDTSELSLPLFEQAREARNASYGKKVFLRGLIEVTSFCGRNCYYCGLRRANKEAQRYRLDSNTILMCCDVGYNLGLRTFVLQGGEDTFFNDDILCDIIYRIKSKFSDCAVTLSFGERSEKSCNNLKKAGADRYLLRHETADSEHFSSLHPASQTFEKRKKTLYMLKDIGFQVGAGFMVGSPYQQTSHLASDLCFLRELEPHMVGIGPFIPHHRTPFAGEKPGSVGLTLTMLALTRLMLPEVLLPATTALATLNKNGHILGLNAGANVIMPNLSPINERKKYDIYDNKASFGSESAEGLSRLKNELSEAGYSFGTGRGDHKSIVL